MKIALVVLIFNLLSNRGSSKPAELIGADLSVSESEIINAVSYGSELMPSLDISDSLGMISSNMESMAEMATESVLEAEALMGAETRLSLESMMSPESIIDNVQSSMYDATSMSSNLMDYTSLISDNPLMSLTDKAQYLSQLSSFSGDQLGMATGLLGMLGGGFISHMQWKLSVITEAKEQLALAMQALASGDMEAVSMHVWEAIQTMQEMCPICQALKYAMNNNDITMLSFAGNIGMSILGQMESVADVSISD